jgi:penicillin-binding protein 1C
MPPILPTAQAAQGRVSREHRKPAAVTAAVPPLGELVRTGGEQALHIQFPLDGSRIDVDRPGDAVSGGVLPITMLVNGMRVGEIDGRRQRLIDPPGPGFARLTAIDAMGAADTIVVRIQ